MEKLIRDKIPVLAQLDANILKIRRPKSTAELLDFIKNKVIEETTELFDAIDQYNSALATAQSLGVTDIVPILEDIVTEEHTHVGQLQAAVKLFDSAANAVEKGAEEAEDQLDTN